jgi:SAM-dependent methyltransferase
MSEPAAPPRTGREFEALAAHAGTAYLRYSFTRGTDQEVDFVTGLLPPRTRLVDVGCGPGRHAAGLAARGWSVTGVDISLPFLKIAGPGRWVRGDARALPLASGSADAVLCLCQGGFGLLGGDDEALAVTEMARILRPGGRLVLSAFSAYFAVRYLEDTDVFDAATGVNHEVTAVRNPAGEDRSFDLWTSCFTPRELRLMVAAAGLVTEHLFSVAPGDYAGRTPDLDHPEWLVVASKPPPRPRGIPAPPV